MSLYKHRRWWAGSGRALASVCVGGTVTFSDALAGQTITLVSGPLTLGKNVTIDGSAAPGLRISGNNSDRVFIVNAGTTATVKHLTITNGYGFQLAGGILNNGSLTLDHAILTQNTMATNAGDFWQGGGGIYNGDGSHTHLIDGSVTNNQAVGLAAGLLVLQHHDQHCPQHNQRNVSNDVAAGSVPWAI